MYENIRTCILEQSDDLIPDQRVNPTEMVQTADKAFCPDAECQPPN
jgi:hypothetical protein